MNQCEYKSGFNERLVGDPVDVVTGANLDVNREFTLPGPLPFIWRRHYDSSKCDWMFALGWGHTHSYDHRLQFDLDGLRYTSPLENAIKFPPVLSDGAQCAAGGFVLRRINLMLYHVIDPAGMVMEFEFRDFDTPAPLRALRQGDASIGFGYGKTGHLESVRDSQARLIKVENDQKGRILSLTLFGDRRPEGRVLLSFRYDAAGNLTQGTDTYRNSFSFKYDQHNRMISRMNRRGYSFHFEYDAEGRCVRSYGEDGLLEVRLRYLVKERVTVVTRADDGQWQYFYDQSGSITRIIDPYGGVRAFIFDANGRVTEEIDPKGDGTQWVYDPAGNFLGKRSSLGHFSSDSDGPLRPDQRVHRVPTRPIEYEYGDMSSLMKAASREANSDILHGFPDSVRRLIRSLAAPQQASPDAAPTAVMRNAKDEGKTYDLTGWLIKESGESGEPRRWVYDAAGNIHRYHDHDGSTYIYERVSWNLRSREINPLGHAVSYAYTRTEKLASLTDAGGTKSEYVYDLKNRLAQVRRHGRLKEEYRYDEADNLIAKLDGQRKPLLGFEIGPHNLKAVRRLASGENHYFNYDERGYYKSVATDDFKVEFDYDQFGNRIRDERDGLGVEHRFSGYRRLTVSTVLDRFEIRYRYISHRIVITDPTGKEHTLGFLDNGAIMRRMSNGSAELSQYNSAGRCLFKSHMRRYGVEGYWTRGYSYSGEGDLLEAQDNLNGRTRYEYDAAHRLKARHRDGKTEEFQYDAANNLLKQPGLDGVSLNEGNRLRTANGDEFEYNDRNNIAVRRGAGAITRYHYDSRDMLTRCETPAGEWRAIYDPLGRRTSKTFGQRRTEFYWDTDRLAAEVNEDGRVRIYVYTDAFAMTPILFVEYESIDADPVSGKRYFIFSDHLGSPVLVEGDDGKVIWQARLDPYGTAHIQGKAAIEMPLRFPGHYFDSETGLHYNRFRYYSPELGRYLQSDPLGIVGSVNLYEYTRNPLKQVDVRGDACTSDEPDSGESPTQRTRDDGTDAEATDSSAASPTVWIHFSDDRVVEVPATAVPGSPARGDIVNIPGAGRGRTVGFGENFPNNIDVRKRPRPAVTPDRNPNLNWTNPDSEPTFGHAITRHGQGPKITRSLTGRAAGTGNPQGQWLNNERAAALMDERRQGMTGEEIVDIPPGLGQIIMPNGDIVPARRAVLRPNDEGGYNTGFPIPDGPWTLI